MQELTDQTNPIQNTAKLTLSILGRAGVREAVYYAERLGFTDICESFDVNEDNGTELPLAILQETRYEFLNRVIRESNCKNIVDIACGFSPRGYIMAKEGYNYRGIDLEESVEVLSKIAGELKKEGLAGSLSYVACDLTDPDALVKAVEDIDGEVLIVCEGLMIYLKPFEGRCLFQGLYRVLSLHGGRFVTPDFEMLSIYKEVHFALLGLEEGMKALMTMANATSEKVDYKWGAHIASKGFDSEKLLSEEKLNVEKISFYSSSERCHVFDQMQETDSKRVIEALLKLKGWSVTVNKDLGNDETLTSYNVPYKAECELQGNVLTIKIRGRVDSMTSNDLLEKYNEAKAGGQFTSIQIDCSNLVFISSAGLRVLMIMKNDVESGKVLMKNVSNTVREIFETTGFDSIVAMC